MSPEPAARSIKSLIIRRLEQGDASELLAVMAYEVCLACRASYVEAGQTPERALEVLRALNEVQIRVAEMALSVRTGRPAYPARAFVDVLREWAQTGNATEELRVALGRTLLAIEQSEPDRGATHLRGSEP